MKQFGNTAMKKLNSIKGNVGGVRLAVNLTQALSMHDIKRNAKRNKSS